MAPQFESILLEQQVHDDEKLRLEVEKLTYGRLAVAYIKSRDGLHLRSDPMTRENVSQFELADSAIGAARKVLESRGFTVLYPGRFAIVMRAPQAVYEKNLGVKFKVRSLAKGTRKPLPSELYLEPDHEFEAPHPGFDGIEHISYPAPATLHQAPALGPDQLDLASLRVRLGIPAGAADNVVIGIVDSGFDLSVLSETVQCKFIGPNDHHPPDASGHGTQMLAIAHALAPGATFLLSAKDPEEYAGFERVANLRPRVLSCSWGWEEGEAWRYPYLRAAIYTALNQGTVVVMSAGNDGDTSWPAALHDVIAVGGVYVDGQGNKAVSDLTSSFESTVEQGRKVPDLSGLSGCKPSHYILVPVPSGSRADVGGSDYGNELDPDGTLPDDGWAFTSKSSGATAQVAAVAGLIRAANPNLDVSTVKQVLMDNCDEVGLPGPGPPPRVSPTGNGLIRGGDAIEAAKQHP